MLANTNAGFFKDKDPVKIISLLCTLLAFDSITTGAAYSSIQQPFKNNTYVKLWG